jgi:predicted small metal-binding protein
MDCREQGMDCDFEITGANEDEMVDFVQIHARSQHDMSVSEDEARDMMENT